MREGTVARIERNKRIINKMINLVENKDDTQTKTAVIKQILEEGTSELTQIPKREKDEAYSNKTRKLLQQRKMQYKNKI